MQKEYEEEIKDKQPNSKKVRHQTESSEDEKDDSDDQEQKMIEDLEKLT